MKNIAKCALLVLTVALCVVGAQAQSTIMLKGNVPFNFVAGNYSHSAGEYTVKDISPDTRQAIEGWFGPNGQSFLLRTSPLDSASSINETETKLVFHRYGDQYYLAEVWTGGNSYEVKSSPRLQKVSKKQGFETVAVLMTGIR